MKIQAQLNEDCCESGGLIHRADCHGAPSNATALPKGSTVQGEEGVELFCGICNPSFTTIPPVAPPSSDALSADSPDWPCRTNPRDDTPDRLIALLYLLARDYVAPGDLEQALLQIRDHIPSWRDVTYSNPHLHAQAKAHAAYLIAELPLVPVEQRTFGQPAEGPLHPRSAEVRKLADDLDRYHTPEGRHADMERAVGVELVAVGNDIRNTP